MSPLSKYLTLKSTCPKSLGLSLKIHVLVLEGTEKNSDQDRKEALGWATAREPGQAWELQVCRALMEEGKV